MTSFLLNIAAYSAQLGVLVAAAIVITLALRVRAPRPSLYFWQAVLLAGILLPILQPRADLPVFAANAAPMLASVNAPLAAISPQGVDLATLLIYVVAGGILLRLLWLALGFLRLRRIVMNATPANSLQPVAGDLEIAIGATAAITVSDEVHTPATIGMWRPLILLPRRILDMPLSIQRAVIAHELVHVRRRDWMCTLFEEFWCAILWFHPAARLLASRLSMSREMVVDEATLLLTGDRRGYAEALLAFSTPQPGAPTTRFLRRGVEAPLPGVIGLIGRQHLSQRISLIAEEDVMSRRRTLASFGIALLVCSVATASAVSALPMKSDAVQTNRVYKPGNGVTVPVVVREAKPVYTPAAMKQKIQGSVFMLVVVLPSGEVGDVQISESLDAEYGLDEEAIKAMKLWKFKPGMRAGKPVAVEVTVQMTFTLK
jgi:TonB family protein